MKPNIAIVSGGFTDEYAVSIKTGENIKKHLESLDKYNLYSLTIDKNAWSYQDVDMNILEVDKNDFSIIYNGEKILFDAVFTTIHGTPGEDGKLGGYFDMLHIPYCMSDVLSAAVTFNKRCANLLLKDSKITCIANSVLIERGQYWSTDDVLSKLSLPVFVKPNEGGSSLATFKVSTPEDMKLAILEALDFDDQVLVEEYIEGREFSVGVYQNGNETIPLPVTELITQNEFFDYHAKYTAGVTNEVTPADIPADIFQEMQTQARQIFNYLNCSYFARIDFIWSSKDNNIYFLEVNTMPGQSDESILPQQVVAAGISLPDFYAMMVDRAIAEGSKI